MLVVNKSQQRQDSRKENILSEKNLGNAEIRTRGSWVNQATSRIQK